MSGRSTGGTPAEERLEEAPAEVGAAPRSRLLYCHCAFARVVPEETKDAVLAGLAEAGEPFDAVPDLCQLAARRDPALERLAHEDRGLRIVACYPRAVRWLFHAAGNPLPEEGVRIHNMRATEASEIVAAVLADAPPPDATPEPATPEPTEPAAGLAEAAKEA